MNTPFDDVPLKRCSKCDKEFPATKQFFHASSAMPDGLRKECKICKISGVGRKPRTKLDPVPEGYKRCYTCKQVYLANTDNFFSSGLSRKTKDGLHGNCKTCMSQRHKRDYRDNIEHHTQVTSKYREANKEHIAERIREYNRLHKEELHEYQKRYNLTHREQYRIRDQKRRALKAAVPGKCTVQDIRDQYKRQKGKCYYCRQKVRWGEHHVDHTFPISRVAGTDIPANGISYLVLTCKPCNHRKGNKFPWEWPEGGRLL